MGSDTSMVHRRIDRRHLVYFADESMESLCDFPSERDPAAASDFTLRIEGIRGFPKPDRRCVLLVQAREIGRKPCIAAR